MRKIGITVTNDLLQDQRMHRIAQTLHDDGFEVVMVGRKKKDSLSVLTSAYTQLRIPCFFNQGVAFYLEYNLRLIFLLFRQRFDIIYSVDLDTLIAGYVGSRISGAKLIHDAHEYFVAVPELSHSKLKQKIWDTVGTVLVKRTDLAITVNAELAMILGERYSKPFSVIRSVPLLVDADPATDAASASRVILYQGMLNKGRGLETAIRAVVSMDNNLVLHIIGEGDLSAELRALATAIDVDRKVLFLGWKTPREMKVLTRQAWIGLNLLTSDSLNYRYSLANKFFDYMHAGLPSVNLDFPVYRRYIDADPVGICLPELNEQELTSALEMLVDHPDTYKGMKMAALKARKKYNWQIESQHLISLIHSTIDG